MAGNVAKLASTDDDDLPLPATRHQRLVETIQARGHVTVAQLTAVFGVSSDTIRRDLTLLERRGLLTRTHGGAVVGEGLVGREVRFHSRMKAQTSAKRRIGRSAAGLIRNGETLILNGGSTICSFAAECGALRDLTIVTNNLVLPAVVPAGAARSIYVLGGAYWESAQISLGPVRMVGTARISVDTAVIGVTGVDKTGLSIGRLEEATETLEMMEAAERTIVLADSSKFGIEAFAHLADFARIQYLVTDAQPAPELVEALDTNGVELVVVAES